MTLTPSTLILQVAVMPLEDMALMVAVPTAFAVTLPLELTVATLSSEEVQMIFLSLGFFGVSVAFRVREFPLVMVALFLLRVILVTPLPLAATVTFTFAETPLSAVMVMLAVPFLIPLILPDEFTVAISLLSLCQVNLADEPSGYATGLMVLTLWPTPMVMASMFRSMRWISPEFSSDSAAGRAVSSIATAISTDANLSIVCFTVITPEIL